MSVILSNEQVLKLNDTVKMLRELHSKNPEMIKDLTKINIEKLNENIYNRNQEHSLIWVLFCV